MRPFAAILKKSLEVRTRGFILSTAVACLGGDVGCGPVQGGRRKVRMREEKGRHHGRRRFSPQPESGSGAGAAGGGGWGKTAPLSSFAPWEGTPRQPWPGPPSPEEYRVAVRGSLARRLFRSCIFSLSNEDFGGTRLLFEIRGQYDNFSILVIIVRGSPRNCFETASIRSRVEVALVKDVIPVGLGGVDGVDSVSRALDSDVFSPHSFDALQTLQVVGEHGLHGGQIYFVQSGRVGESKASRFHRCLAILCFVGVVFRAQGHKFDEGSFCLEFVGAVSGAAQFQSCYYFLFDSLAGAGKDDAVGVSVEDAAASRHQPSHVFQHRQAGAGGDKGVDHYLLAK